MESENRIFRIKIPHRLENKILYQIYIYDFLIRNPVAEYFVNNFKKIPSEFPRGNSGPEFRLLGTPF
jgi:hypothetical protein